MPVNSERVWTGIERVLSDVCACSLINCPFFPGSFACLFLVWKVLRVPGIKCTISPLFSFQERKLCWMYLAWCPYCWDNVIQIHSSFQNLSLEWTVTVVEEINWYFHAIHWGFYKEKPLLTFWRKQLSPCWEDLHCPRSQSKAVHVFMGAAVGDLACLHGGSKWQSLCWQTWFEALETVIVTGKCHCAVKEGERNFSLFTFLEILSVVTVAAVRSWDLKLPHNRNKLEAVI